MSTVRIQIRRGTAAQWTAANPTLAAGEMGVESDTRKTKIGTGSTAWTALAYANVVPSDLSNTLSDYLEVADRGVANGVASLDAQGQVPINQLGNVIDAAPGVLDTLNELAAAINDDASFVTTINTSIATKLALAGGTMTGAIAMGNNKITGLATPTADYDASTKKYADDLQTQTVAGIASHAAISTNVHGVVDMAALATMTYVNTEVASHQNDTTNVHGIGDTALLATQEYATNAVTAEATARGAAITAEATARAAAITAAATTAATNLDTHTADTTSVHGISDTSLLALKSEVAAVTAASLGLGNVDNTSDANKPVSTAQATAIAAAQAAAIADATSQVNAVIASAPGALNTLDELAAALGDDENYATSITTALAGKVDSYTPIVQKTGSYTLTSLTERDDLIEVNSASAAVISIPEDATVNYPIGTSLDILQTGSGEVSIAGVSGTVTVNATPGLKLRTQWSSATIFKRAANTWVVYGDLKA
jgi:hypothetical protein